MADQYEELRRAVAAHVIANDERSARNWRVNVLSKCKPETIDSLLAELNALREDARRYQLLRRGQHWSVINGIGDVLRADALDAAIDALHPSKDAA